MKYPPDATDQPQPDNAPERTLDPAKASQKAPLDKQIDDSQPAQHVCQQTGDHYYASESIPGGLIHWIRICMTCGHKDEKDLNEQITALLAEAEKKGRKAEHNLTRRHYHPDNDPAKFEAFLNERLFQLEADTPKSITDIPKEEFVRRANEIAELEAPKQGEDS